MCVLPHLVCCATFQELQHLFVGKGGKPVKSGKQCRENAKAKGPETEGRFLWS
ncbi:hypothetical protein V1527DRAFT_348278 [Lipomyces starkeyi]